MNLLIELLLERVTVVAQTEFIKYLPQATSIMQNIDRNDSPFLALALSFYNDGIWSHDKHFEKQAAVRVWKTEELLQLLREDKIK